MFNCSIVIIQTDRQGDFAHYDDPVCVNFFFQAFKPQAFPTLDLYINATHYLSRSQESDVKLTYYY